MDSGIEAIEGQATKVLRLARNVHAAALVTAVVLTTLTFLLARIFRRKEKVSHTVARGVSLGASGHMSVKARRHVWCLATSSLPHSTTLHHLDMQASSRYRSIARDRRGLLLGRCTA